MDPRTRLGLLVCVGVLAVCLDRPGSLLLLTALCALPLLWMRVSAAWWRRGALLTAALVWSTVLSQGLFYADVPRIPLFRVGPLVVWEQGVVWGLVQSLRLVATALAGLSVAISTPPDRVYAALLRLRVPFSVAFLAVTALRTVPETARSMVIVRKARRRRGRPAWRRSPWAWMKLEAAMLRPVVADSLRRARALAESLETRGFDPDAPRAVRRPLVMAGWERGLLGAAFGVTASVAALRLLFVLYTTEIAYLPELRGLYGFVRAWM